jgi:1,4-alpha-glucan branching enzyme
MSEDKKKSIKKNKEKGDEPVQQEKIASKNKKKSTNSHQRYEDVHFVDSTKSVWNYSLFSNDDIKNFQNGTHYSLYNLFGAHQREVLGVSGYYFAVWAPNATYVSLKGNFNGWSNDSHPLYVRLEKSGIWEGFIPN